MKRVYHLPTSEEWLAAFLSSFIELAQSSLNLQGSKVINKAEIMPWSDTVGAYVPWVNDQYAIQLGLLSSKQGCKQLAKLLLSMKPDEEITNEDMTDAMQEIVNILAGMTKGIVGGAVATKSMGLPVFIDGYISMAHTHEVLAELVRIGDIYCYLIILHTKRRLT